MNTRADFIPGGYYHVYNQTNGGEALFKNDENRSFFLRRFCNFLKPFVYVHSYALMRNHFHFSIQVKGKEEIKEWVDGLEESNLTITLRKLKLEMSDNSKLSDIFDPSDIFNQAIIEQFKRFFVSYTKAFNKAHNRKGSLFRQKFKRSHFDPEIKFHYLQYYIHHNARKHRVVKKFDDYPHTSYFEIVNGETSVIDIDKVYVWFLNQDDFIKFHVASHYEEVFTSIDLDEFIPKK